MVQLPAFSFSVYASLRRRMDFFLFQQLQLLCKSRVQTTDNLAFAGKEGCTLSLDDVECLAASFLGPAPPLPELCGATSSFQLFSLRIFETKDGFLSVSAASTPLQKQSADHGQLSICRKEGCTLSLDDVECLAASFLGPAPPLPELCGATSSFQLFSLRIFETKDGFLSVSAASTPLQKQSADHGQLSICRKEGCTLSLDDVECLAASFLGPAPPLPELCGATSSFQLFSLRIFETKDGFLSVSAASTPLQKQSADHGQLSICRKRGMYIYIYINHNSSL